MQVKFSLRNAKRVQDYLKSLPRGVKIAAMRAIAEYIIGDESRGLKHYPMRVEHDENNPYKWQSEKQRKAYFATNGFGAGIPYQRTDNLKNSWSYKEANSNWTMVKIENSAPYAGFVQGNQIQRGHIADKWRKFADVVKSNLAGAIRHANAEVRRYLNSRK